MVTSFGLLGRKSSRSGQETPAGSSAAHFLNGRPLGGPYPDGTDRAVFGLGCFWGAERLFWELEGVWVTAVGYSGGQSHNPTYREVCSGTTGHAETVLVIFDPLVTGYQELLRIFWEAHDPTQGMRQGNDIGTQYRSVIEYHCAQQGEVARRSRDAYGAVLSDRGRGPITTELVEAGPFYFAESDHQQYLAKNPAGYCGLAGTGVACPAN